MVQDDLILGVDGGGSKTIAWLARNDDRNLATVIGRGRTGPSNVRSIGIAQATANLDRAIESAFHDARLPRRQVASACFSLAGCDRAAEQQQIRSWAASNHVADRLLITNDALPVLYAASRDGIGVALISGTGSLALGRNADGETARCGGWGGSLGDEGSGYQISLAGLKATARAADGRGQATTISQGIFHHLKIAQASELIPIVYSPQTDPSTIAMLAPIVFQAAQAGDPVATAIIDSAATELSEMVATVAAKLSMADLPFSLALSGGVLLHQPKLVDKIFNRLAESKLQVSIVRVEEPVAGAISIALET